MKPIIIFSLTALLTVGSTSIVFAKKFKNKKEQCAYLEEKKEQAEERMREGYTIKQYNKLEAKRKYWKKQYIDTCF